MWWHSIVLVVYKSCSCNSSDVWKGSKLTTVHQTGEQQSNSKPTSPDSPAPNYLRERVMDKTTECSYSVLISISTCPLTLHSSSLRSQMCACSVLLVTLNHYLYLRIPETNLMIPETIQPKQTRAHRTAARCQLPTSQYHGSCYFWS